MASHYQEIINIVGLMVVAVVGWFARELWSAVKQLKEDLNRLRVEIPKTYVAREDFRSDIRDIKEMLGKIFDKIDTKQDKVRSHHEL